MKLFLGLLILSQTIFLNLVYGEGSTPLNIHTMLAPNTPSVQNGRSVSDKEYPQVVGLSIKSTTYSEKDKKIVDVSGICTGFIFNGNCVVTASHCIKDNKTTLQGIDIFTQANMTGEPFTSLSKDSVIPHPEMDLAVIKMDKRFSANRSFTLSDIEMGIVAKGTKTKAVGYGSNQVQKVTNKETGFVDLIPSGAGTKRVGDIVVTASNIEKGRIQSYEANADPERWDALPNRGLQGDSGGPILTDVDGKVKVLGVFKHLQKSSGEGQYTALAHHTEWLKKTFEKLGCESESNQVEAVKPFIDGFRKSFPLNEPSDESQMYKKLQTLLKDPKFSEGVWEPMRQTVSHLLAEKGELNKKYFEHVGFKSVKKEKDGWVLKWEGQLVRNEPGAGPALDKLLAQKKITNLSRPEGRVKIYQDGRIVILTK